MLQRRPRGLVCLQRFFMIILQLPCTPQIVGTVSTEEGPHRSHPLEMNDCALTGPRAQQSCAQIIIIHPIQGWCLEMRQNAQWLPGPRKPSCPGVFMYLLHSRRMTHGCGENAMATNALARSDSKRKTSSITRPAPMILKASSYTRTLRTGPAAIHGESSPDLIHLCFRGGAR